MARMHCSQLLSVAVLPPPAGGYKVGPDGRGGEQPRGTVVENNICHEM